MEGKRNSGGLFGGIFGREIDSGGLFGGIVGRGMGFEEEKAGGGKEDF